MMRARPAQSDSERLDVRHLAAIGFLVTAVLGIALVAIAVVLEEILPADCAIWCRQDRATTVAMGGFLFLLLSSLGLIAVLASFLRSRLL